MSKAVLISIQPKWCEKIANGEKTVEVRKTQPKLKTPFKCYIYCTNKKPYLVWGDVFRGGSFENEFTHLSGYNRKAAEEIWDVFNGKVIGEFVCDRILDCRDVPREPTCLTVDDWLKYTDGHKGPVYGWHISELKIYDTPKELGEFTPSCRYGEDGECIKTKEVLCLFQKHDFNPDGSVNFVSCSRRAKRPPQSWCYVEELPEGDG